MTAATPNDRSSPRPLPFRPRPVTGKSTGSYIRRLARANHLRPAYLRRYLASPKDKTIRIELLAAMAGRSPAALEHALADLGPQQGTLSPRGPRASPDRIGARAALFAAIRRDAADVRLSYRALADRHGVHRRTVQQALQSPVPAPRKPMPPRKSRLEPFKDVIRDMVQADHDGRRTVTSIMNTLVTDHGMTGISYPTVRGYVVSLRSGETARSVAQAGRAPASRRVRATATPDCLDILSRLSPPTGSSRRPART